MKYIEIYTYGDSKNGMGHISRAKTLRKFLVNKGYKVNFFIADYKKCLNTFQKKNYLNGSSEILIFDLPYEINQIIKIAKKNGANIIKFDGTFSKEVDLSFHVFDQGFLINQNVYSGLEYAIIREDVLKFANESPSDRSKVSIVLGGADINCHSFQVANFLIEKGINPESIRVIFGPLTKCLDNVPNKFNYFVSPNNYPELIFNSSWCISNGGTTLLEMMFLKKAVYVIPQSENERLFAEKIFQMGGILGIGLDNLYIPSKDKIDTVGKLAGKLIDGLGCNRIELLIKQYFD